MANKKKIKKTDVAPRQRISQGDLPAHSLREALTVAQAITDNFAGGATAPHQVAMALDISPTSSIWRSLAGAAMAYGLTTGGYAADKIGLQELGRRCTAPKKEGDDIAARSEAAMKPSTLRAFFEKYNRAKLPNDQIAMNVLQQDFHVPTDRLAEALKLIKDNGTYVGAIQNTKTGMFVSTDDLKPAPVTVDAEPEIEHDPSELMPGAEDDPTPAPARSEPKPAPEAEALPFKVFITHGKNKKIVDQVKDVLDLYDIDYEIAVEEESPAIPVPQKVLSAMRRCAAGIMVVSVDGENADAINNNVLIEIGAAFVLYDQKVVLLWDSALKVPSNLQGLYRCEFAGDELTFSVGTKLAKAVKGFKK